MHVNQDVTHGIAATVQTGACRWAWQTPSCTPWVRQGDVCAQHAVAWRGVPGCQDVTQQKQG